MDVSGANTARNSVFSNDGRGIVRGLHSKNSHNNNNNNNLNVEDAFHRSSNLRMSFSQPTKNDNTSVAETGGITLGVSLNLNKNRNNNNNHSNNNQRDGNLSLPVTAPASMAPSPMINKSPKQQKRYHNNNKMVLICCVVVCVCVGMCWYVLYVVYVLYVL